MERHTAFYVRVSSTSQDLRSQRADLERWAEVHTAVEPPRWYVDKSSGSTMERPGWQELEAQLRAGSVARLVVWRLDRLGRTALGLLGLFKELEHRKVGLVSLREGLDMATPGGRLFAHMLASIAEYEREVSRERQTAGIRAARAAGKRWGGSVKGRRWKITPEIEGQVRSLKAAGHPIVAIARTMKIAPNSVYAVLRAKPASP